MVPEAVELEKTLESLLDCKEIKPVNPKGNQSWILIGRTDAEAETPILWLPDAKNWLIGKDPDAGKDWRQEDKGTTEDERSSTRWIWVWARSGSWWRTGKPDVPQFTVTKSRTQLSNWTELIDNQLLLSHSSRVRLCATPQTAAHQAPPSLGFSRQEHWSGLPFPSPMHESEKWKWSHSVISDS